MLLALVLTVLAGCAGGPGESSSLAETSSPADSSLTSASSEAEDAAERVEIIVFAAASMTETLNQIIEMYREVAPHVTVTATYDSSGTLKTQIEEGAVCDIFLSAAPKQMNQLDLAADEVDNPDRLDFVLEGTRENLLENKVALVVPDGNPKEIGSFEDLMAALNAMRRTTHPPA